MPIGPSSVAAALMQDFRLAQLVTDRPVRRDLTSLNVERGPKERFERIAAIYSSRLGRKLTHWEAFAILVAEAEELYAFELATMRGR